LQEEIEEDYIGKKIRMARKARAEARRLKKNSIFEKIKKFKKRSFIFKKTIMFD